MCAAASELTSSNVDGAGPNVAASTRTADGVDAPSAQAWQNRAQPSASTASPRSASSCARNDSFRADSSAARSRWLLARTSASTSRMRSTWRGPRSAGSVAVCDTRPTARPWSSRWRAIDAVAVTAYSSVLSTPEPAWTSALQVEHDPYVRGRVELELAHHQACRPRHGWPWMRLNASPGRYSRTDDTLGVLNGTRTPCSEPPGSTPGTRPKRGSGTVLGYTTTLDSVAQPARRLKMPNGSPLVTHTGPRLNRPRRVQTDLISQTFRPTGPSDSTRVADDDLESPTPSCSSSHSRGHHWQQAWHSHSSTACSVNVSPTCTRVTRCRGEARARRRSSAPTAQLPADQQPERPDQYPGRVPARRQRERAAEPATERAARRVSRALAFGDAVFACPLEEGNWLLRVDFTDGSDSPGGVAPVPCSWTYVAS